MLNIKEAHRFLSKIKKVDSGCWEWQPPLGSCGYGRFHYNKKVTSAHRISYAWYQNLVLEDIRGSSICHHCDNPRCVNPSHLYKGNCKTNSDDKFRRGRNPDHTGSNNPSSKLTDKDIGRLVKLLPVMNNKEIANDFKGIITHSMVSRIRLGQAWSKFTGIKEGDSVKYSTITKKRK